MLLPFLIQPCVLDQRTAPNSLRSGYEEMRRKLNGRDGQTNIGVGGDAEREDGDRRSLTSMTRMVDGALGCMSRARRGRIVIAW